MLALLHRFVLQLAGLGKENLALIFSVGVGEDAAEVDIGAADLVVGAGLVAAGQLDGLAQHRLGPLGVVLRVGVESQIEERFGRRGVDFGGGLEVFVRLVVLTLAGEQEAEHVVGEIVAGEILDLFAKLGLGLGCGLPFVERELGEAEEVMRVGRSRVEGDGALEFANGGGHVVGIAVGSSEQDMEGAAVAGHLGHSVEDGLGANLVLGLAGLQQAVGEGIEVLDAGLRGRHGGERRDGLGEVSLLDEGAGEDAGGADIVRIGGEGLLGEPDGFVRLAGLRLGKGEVDPGGCGVLEIQGVAVEIDGLRISGFDLAEAGEFAKSEGDESLVGEGHGGGVSGIAGRGGGGDAGLELAWCLGALVRSGPLRRRWMSRGGGE